jgi:hypothetical protein
VSSKANDIPTSRASIGSSPVVSVSKPASPALSSLPRKLSSSFSPSSVRYLRRSRGSPGGGGSCTVAGAGAGAFPRISRSMVFMP